MGAFTGDRPDVVLMPVGDEDAPDLSLIFDEIAHIGNDHVDAVHIVIREPHAAVHHDDVVAILIDCQVLADLIQTAQRDDFQFFSHKIFVTSFLIVASQHCSVVNRRKAPGLSCAACTMTRRRSLLPRPCLAWGKRSFFVFGELFDTPGVIPSGRVRTVRESAI